MKKEKLYHGVVVPMVTPIAPEGGIDEIAVGRLIESFATAGVSPLLLGTTGEGNSVSHRDAVCLVKTAAECSRHRVIIYACLTGNCMEEQLQQAVDFKNAGADVLAATLPCYYSLTPEQIYYYYHQLADQVPLPLMLYNIVATTHMSIPVDVVRRLADHPNIVGLKDSERNDERMSVILSWAKHREDFSYFCGCAAKSALALSLGADGIVPSGGNFVAELYQQLYEAGVAGDTDRALSLQAQTDQLGRIYQEGFTLGESLAALKTICLTLGLLRTDAMLPPLTTFGVSDTTARIVSATQEEIIPLKSS